MYEVEKRLEERDWEKYKKEAGVALDGPDSSLMAVERLEQFLVAEFSSGAKLGVEELKKHFWICKNEVQDTEKEKKDLLRNKIQGEINALDYCIRNCKALGNREDLIRINKDLADGFHKSLKFIDEVFGKEE